MEAVETGNLLADRGHKVIFWGMEHPLNPEYLYQQYFVSYIDLNAPANILEQGKLAARILYCLEAKRKIEKLIRIEKPDLVHLNNFAHQISPSILDVFKKYKIPTVMTLRDYKLVCPAYVMLRRGIPCQECANGRFYRCLFNKCIKNSYAKSLLSSLEMYIHHNILNIYKNIDVIIATSCFSERKNLEMGLHNRVMRLSNFVNVEEYQPRYQESDNTIIYFGRLSEEKGLFTLLNAVRGLNICLKVVGDGPIRSELEKKATQESLNNVVFTGYKSGDELKEEVRHSTAAVVPSECYETFGRAVVESFSMGKPVIGARMGVIPELVKDNETGFTFEPGNWEDLRSKIGILLRNPDLVEKMGKRGRRFMETNLNPEKHYQQLMEIYQIALRGGSH